MFRNIYKFSKSVPKHSDLFSRLSYFQNVLKLLVYFETFRFVLENISKKSVPEHSDVSCSRNTLTCLVDCFVFRIFRNIQICFGNISKIFRKHSDLFSGHFKSVLEHKEVFKSIPKHSDLFSRLSYFHNILKLSETFRLLWKHF